MSEARQNVNNSKAAIAQSQQVEPPAAVAVPSTEALIGADRQGTITAWNIAAERLFGFTTDEALGKSAFELVCPPDQRQPAIEILDRVMAGQGPFHYEAQRQKKDGSRIDVAVTIIGVCDPAGQINTIWITYQDISEHKQAQAELEHTHAYIRSLFESSLDAILTLTSDLTITDVNNQTVKLIGSTRATLIGSRFDHYFTEPECAAQGIAHALREGFLANCDLALKTADNREIPVSFNASVLPGIEGQPREVFVVARDVTHHKELEKQLRETQAYTRSQIEASLDAMLTVDSNLVITDVNERTAILAEMPKAMLIGSRFDRLFTDPPRAETGVREALIEGAVTNYDLTLRALSGRETLISFNASVFHDTKGEFMGVFVVARDVTAQRRTEQQWREQQIYTRSLFESSLDALLTLDPQLTITDVNQQALSLTGYAREELIGRSFPVLFTDPKRAAEAMNQGLANGYIKDYELTLLSATGAELAVSFNASTIKDARGMVFGILAAPRDISERRHLESERSLLASIVTTSPDAICSYTPQAIIISWNTGAERLFGYSTAEIIGRSMTICTPLELRSELFERLNMILSGKGTQQFETQRRRKDGELIHVSVTMAPITGEQGNITAIASIYRDISERKHFELELTKARDEALESTRARSEFLANMSHEIRTPLNSIIGLADMMLDATLSEEQRLRMITIKENATAMLTILNDILNFSKLAAGKLVFESVTFNLEDAVHETLSAFAETARSKGLEFISYLEPDVPQLLRGDPERLRQALANLVSNAIKFTQRGEVVVRVAKLSESMKEAMLRFEVRDTGIGIPLHAQSRLFRAFSQADASITTQYGGTGLGLAITRELVQRMGGSIGLTSAPGAGSTFWFTVRLAKPPEGMKQTLTTALGLEGVRALIVDDNSYNREAFSAWLKSWKMAPDTAATPAEGIAKLRQAAQQGDPFVLGLFDMQMPEMDGVELARWIHRQPGIPRFPVIILSSASVVPQPPEASAELSISGVLLKPVKQSALFESVIRALRISALEQRRHAASEPLPAAALEPISGLHGSPLCVLLAEDNAANREVALWQLHKLGCKADAVVNGYEVLEAVGKTPYDLILMDCRMPQMDGYETTRQIRQREGSDRHTRIVAMTAHALAGDRKKCLDAGMDDYIAKPVGLESLVAIMRKVMEARPDTSLPSTEAPVAPPHEVPAPALDAATMAALRAKPGLLPDLIETVLGEMPEQLKLVADSLAACNYADAAISAHSLKGTARIFGAVRMAELADAVEQAANAESAEQAAAQLEQLKQACAQVCRELEDERGRQAAEAN